jgi:hypothetical protein
VRLEGVVLSSIHRMMKRSNTVGAYLEERPSIAVSSAQSPSLVASFGSLEVSSHALDVWSLFPARYEP